MIHSSTSSTAKGVAITANDFYELVKVAEADALANCSVPSILRYGQPYDNGVTFHTIISIVATIATVLCCLISCFVAIGHLVNYVNPPEQKQLLRVISTLPIFAICSSLSCWFYGAGPFLEPVRLLSEAISIVALFYFYVNCVTPNESVREEFYDGLERQKRFHNHQQKHDHGSLRWFHFLWICIFQVCLGRIGTTIAYEWLHATQCPASHRLRLGTAIIRIVQSVQTAIAVIAVIHYEYRMKSYMKGHRSTFKLISFKLIVFVEFIQSIVFAVLAVPTVGIFTPSYNISFYDFSVGIPAFMLCVEVFLFSVVFTWSYNFSPYRKLAKDGHQKAGFAKGMWDVINIMDIVKGIGYLFTALAPGNFGTKYVQRPRDATMVDEHGVGRDFRPVMSGSDSEPGSLPNCMPVHPSEKV